MHGDRGALTGGCGAGGRRRSGARPLSDRGCGSGCPGCPWRSRDGGGLAWRRRGGWSRRGSAVSGPGGGALDAGATAARVGAQAPAAQACASPHVRLLMLMQQLRHVIGSPKGLDICTDCG